MRTPKTPPSPELSTPEQGLAILEGFTVPESPPGQGEYGGVRVSIFDRRPNPGGNDDLIDNGPW